MVFLTNKSINNFKDIDCKVTGYAFTDIDTLKIPEQLVVDISNDMPINVIKQLLNKFGCKYIEAPMELLKGNTVFLVQEAQQNLIQMDIL